MAEAKLRCLNEPADCRAAVTEDARVLLSNKCTQGAKLGNCRPGRGPTVAQGPRIDGSSSLDRALVEI